MKHNRTAEDNDVEIIRQIVAPFNAIPLQFGPRGPQFPLTHLPNQMTPGQQAIFHQQQPQDEMMRPHPQVETRQFALPQFPHSWMRPQSQFQSMPEQQRQSPLNRQQPEVEIREIPFHQFLQQQQQQPIPAQMMEAPRPQQQQPHQPEIRIQLQRVQIPMREIKQDISDEQQQSQEQDRGMPQVQVQQLPLAVALQRAGITAEDLRNIQRMAENRIQEELRQYVSSDSDSSSDEQNSTEDNDNQSKSEETQQQQQPQILAIGRSAYGRSLVTPIRIPVPMMQQMQDSITESSESERPHCKYSIVCIILLSHSLAYVLNYIVFLIDVHPRSVRSVENVFVDGGAKRIKRSCACTC